MRVGGFLISRVLTGKSATMQVCALVFAIALALTGCGHKTETYQPPPPPIDNTQRQSRTQTHTTPAITPPASVSDEDREFVRTHKPLLTEEGLATWYTAAKG